MKNLASFGVYAGDMLLPKDSDMSRWSVIACDQFTSQMTYWEELAEFVGTAPSALNLILPEAYLEKADADARIARVNDTMHDYVAGDVFKTLADSFVYVRRDSESGIRHGLVCTVDLACYDPQGKGLIRPTEGTVASRVPPRMKIRKNACVELSHVMLLCDDKNMAIFRALEEATKNDDPIYDFDVSMGGGHLKGFVVDSADKKAALEKAFLEAAEEAATRNGEGAPFLVVGDGNHSLAAAKAHWENVKAAGAGQDHPARYAMVEIVSIHDPSIIFEPIHRVIFDTNQEKLTDQLIHAAKMRGFGAKVCECAVCGEDEISIPMIYDGQQQYFVCENPFDRWAIHILQQLLDDIDGLNVDYIHGDDTVRDLCQNDTSVGFFLPPTDKDTFFHIIATQGVMPRKTFSIGHAHQKRYYTEAREIV